MKIDKGPNPNCSEAVFRFYTLDTDEMVRIIKSIANELGCPERDPIRIPNSDEPRDFQNINFCRNDGAITVLEDMRAFVVNIRNNDLGRDWIDTVKDIGVFVEEGESSEELYQEWARDCTCGKEWFSDYEKQLDKSLSKFELGVRKALTEEVSGDGNR